MNQTEYGLAYGLVIGLITLGVLAICVPRPRKKDLPENLKKEQDEKRIAAGKKQRTAR
jgi:hypothetical protein